MARGRHLYAALAGDVLRITTLLVLCVLSFSAAVRAQTSAAPTLIIRSDDAGMSHSVNMALERLIKTGLPLSISVMFPTPWYQETVGILKQHPEVSVGIHLTLNSEWRNYRWGPITGREAVPTLCDSNGYFFQSAEALHDNHPDLSQVEKELRAQIDRALKSGLKIDYVDYHMGTAVEYPEFREIVERLAHEYSLGMMGYFGDSTADPQYRADPAHKADSLVALVNRLQTGVTVLVTHVGIDDAELGALIDMNTAEPLADMSKNRQGELTGLTSPRFAQALKDRHIHLITYRELIGKQGLQSMRRPPQ
jgi:predicted glycoside hydrolase/deacetylase ChbG (UPF0249 family)